MASFTHRSVNIGSQFFCGGSCSILLNLSRNHADGGSTSAKHANIAAAAAMSPCATGETFAVAFRAGNLVFRRAAGYCYRLEYAQSLGAPLHPNKVQLTPSDRRPRELNRILRRNDRGAENQLAPSSRDAKFTASPITV